MYMWTTFKVYFVTEFGFFPFPDFKYFSFSFLPPSNPLEISDSFVKYNDFLHNRKKTSVLLFDDSLEHYTHA